MHPKVDGLELTRRIRRSGLRFVAAQRRFEPEMGDLRVERLGRRECRASIVQMDDASDPRRVMTESGNGVGIDAHRRRV